MDFAAPTVVLELDRAGAPPQRVRLLQGLCSVRRWREVVLAGLETNGQGAVGSSAKVSPARRYESRRLVMESRRRILEAAPDERSAPVEHIDWPSGKPDHAEWADEIPAQDREQVTHDYM